VQHFKTLYPIIQYDPNMKANPTNWLVNDLWQEGKINGMAGFEKSGKSRLMNWVLVGMSAGSVLGLNASPKKILYLCGEETVAHVNARIYRYAELQGIPKNQFDIGFIEAAAMRLDIKKQRDEMLESILDNDYEMLVIDPWRRVHGADEDKSVTMSPIYNDLRKWSNKHGLTILLLHHTPKLTIDTDLSRMASWFRGSTDLPAILDTAQYIDRLDHHTIEIRRQGRFPPLPKLRIIDKGGKSLNDDQGFERAT
jgi:RecA-family ATPase